MRLTDYRASVYEVQSALRSISQEKIEVRPRLIPDGIYGEETKDAVCAFQTYVGLAVTGVVDFQTWQALFGQKY